MSTQDGVTVRIIAEDGTEVAGSFIAPGVWRPDQPFALGTYTADLSYEEQPDWVHDTEFEVTAAVTPSPDLIQLAVSSALVADGSQVLEETCCLAGQSRSTPCNDDCGPLCLATVYGGKQIVLVETKWPSEALSAQLQVTEIAQTEPGEYNAGYWDVMGSPAQLCGVASVFSWLDESTTVLRTCIPNPRPEVVAVKETALSFGYDGQCTIPPSGYETLWCEERKYHCTQWILTPEGQQDDTASLACEHYDEVCGEADGTNPTPDEGNGDTSEALGENTDESADGNPGDTTDQDPTEPVDSEEAGEPNDNESELAEPKLRRVEPAKGCSMWSSPKHPSTMNHWPTLLLFTGLGSILGIRRVQLRARRQG